MLNQSTMRVPPPASELGIDAWGGRLGPQRCQRFQEHNNKEDRCQEEEIPAWARSNGSAVGLLRVAHLWVLMATLVVEVHEVEKLLQSWQTNEERDPHDGAPAEMDGTFLGAASTSSFEWPISIMKYHEVMSLILGLHTQTMPALMWRYLGTRAWL